MTDTPRTDKAVHPTRLLRKLDGTFAEAVDAVTCRQLERELAETKRLLMKAQHWHSEALRIGEKFADVGPKGYYSYTSEEWFRWALPAIEEKMRLLKECGTDWLKNDCVICRAEAAEAKLAQIDAGGWISVNDKLPENEAYVLGYAPNCSMTVRHKNRKFYAGWNCDTLYDVTHWHQLPKPPCSTR